MGAALPDYRAPLASSDLRGRDARAPGSMTALSDHILPQHAGETPVLPGFWREAETALEESLGERGFAAGEKGLFRAVPSITIVQKRPKGPQGRSFRFHSRGNSRKSSPRGV